MTYICSPTENWRSFFSTCGRGYYLVLWYKTRYVPCQKATYPVSYVEGLLSRSIIYIFILMDHQYTPKFASSENKIMCYNTLFYFHLVANFGEENFLVKVTSVHLSFCNVGLWNLCICMCLKWSYKYPTQKVKIQYLLLFDLLIISSIIWYVI